MSWMWTRWAGIWGPLGFVAASTVAARRQVGYSHRSNHVSGLASKGESSASIMIPGFLVLAGAHAVLPAPSEGLRRLVRFTAVTTSMAGLVRVSDPRCPQPGVDADATASDVGHGAASIATFVVWAAMPVVAARDEQAPAWYRRAARRAIVPTVITFVAAGATTRRNSSTKGIAQRAFLATVFTFLAVTGFAGSLPEQDASIDRQGPSTAPRGRRLWR